MITSKVKSLQTVRFDASFMRDNFIHCNHCISQHTLQCGYVAETISINLD